MKIHKSDMVKIMKGNDRGKTGEILMVDRNKKKIVVKGVNVVKRSAKSQKNNPHGGIIDKTLPINIANAALVCPLCSKPTRVGYKTVEGNKMRLCHKCQKTFK